MTPLFSEDAVKSLVPSMLVCLRGTLGESVEMFSVDCKGLCFSFFSIVSAARRICSIFSVRLVRWPPRQISTPEIMPHKNDAGMSVPVVHAGRSNLFHRDLTP